MSAINPPPDQFERQLEAIEQMSEEATEAGEGSAFCLALYTATIITARVMHATDPVRLKLYTKIAERVADQTAEEMRRQGFDV